MSRHRGRAEAESGNIMIAMLGIMVLSFIVIVGMTQMVISEHVTRHDRNFEQALAAAEAGLSNVVTQVKASPYAASITPVSGSDSSTHTTWTATATGGAGSWVLTASGTANGSATPVTRTITQTIQVRNLLGDSDPLFAVTSLNVGGGSASGVDTYDSAVDSSVCTPSGTAASMGYSGARMCTHATPALGRIGTDGPLTLPNAALVNVSGVDIYATGTPGYPDPLDTGSCAGDTTTCLSSQVVRHEDALAFPLSTQCSSGVGAGATAYDGSLALAANAVYNFTDVTLNATAVANLQNLSGSTLVICFSGTLNVVPTVPVNSMVQTVVPLRLEPRPPATLILISTSGSPKIKLNAGLGVSSSLSAVVFAPNADCSATAHVDVYGMLVCGTMSAPQGINVHSDVEVAKIPFDQPVTLSKWREK
jgi:hypothetical protein